jgi:hypothetical protein
MPKKDTIKIITEGNITTSRGDMDISEIRVGPCIGSDFVRISAGAGGLTIWSAALDALTEEWGRVRGRDLPLSVRYSADDLAAAAREVANCWESGDLAGAVRALSAAVQFYETDLDGTQPQAVRVIVRIEGDAIQLIQGARGVTVDVRDYDVLPSLVGMAKTDDEGDQYLSHCWTGDGND